MKKNSTSTQSKEFDKYSVRYISYINVTPLVVAYCLHRSLQESQKNLNICYSKKNHMCMCKSIDRLQNRGSPVILKVIPAHVIDFKRGEATKKKLDS